MLRVKYAGLVLLQVLPWEGSVMILTTDSLIKATPHVKGLERKNREEPFRRIFISVYGKRKTLTVVPDAGHDHAKKFASPEGMKWLFYLYLFHHSNSC